MRLVMNRRCLTQDIPCQRRKGASFSNDAGWPKVRIRTCCGNNVTRKHALGTRAAMEQIAQAGKFIHITYELPAYLHGEPTELAP
jgi:hypothetical protein